MGSFCHLPHEIGYGQSVDTKTRGRLVTRGSRHGKDDTYRYPRPRPDSGRRTRSYMNREEPSYRERYRRYTPYPRRQVESSEFQQRRTTNREDFRYRRRVNDARSPWANNKNRNVFERKVTMENTKNYQGRSRPFSRD